MHNRTDQMELPMRAEHARAGESPATSAHFQCQHLWSAVGADGYMECRWCRAKQRPEPTTISDHTTPLRSNANSPTSTSHNT